MDAEFSLSNVPQHCGSGVSTNRSSARAGERQ